MSAEQFLAVQPITSSFDPKILVVFALSHLFQPLQLTQTHPFKDNMLPESASWKEKVKYIIKYTNMQ